MYKFVSTPSNIYLKASHFAAVLFFLWSTGSTAQVEFQSKASAVHLIELYTSEGCYSCPPADRWLSELKSSQQLFKEFIPLSFHVDYWNYLGWKDKYSRQEFSERQRRYYQLGQVSGVYTPGMFLDGREWRLWRSQESKRFHKAKTLGSQTVGVLTAKHDNKQTMLHFVPSNAETFPSQAYVALLGVDISAPIAAGENKGKTLKHDFVVLDLQQTRVSKNADGSYSATLPAIETKLTAPRYALATWITDQKNRKPIQATGGWLP